MAKKKLKRPPAPDPIIEQDLNEVWVYYTRPTLLYPIPWKGWPSLEVITKFKNLLENGTTKVNNSKKRR